MSDPAGGHPQTAEGPARVSRLTERLLARGTRPLGLIDVRRAESHYARIMDWLARRTPLLEHLMSRYGLTEGEGATALSLAFADARAIEGEGAPEAVGGSDLSTVPEAFAPDAFTPRAAEGLVTYVARVPEDFAVQTEAKRIRRRGVPTPSRPDTETRPPDAGAHTQLNEDARQRQSWSDPTTPKRFEPSPEPASSHPEQSVQGVEVPEGSQAAPSVKEIPIATAEAQELQGVGAPLAFSSLPPEATQSPVQRHPAPTEGRAAAPMAESETALETERGRRAVSVVKEIDVPSVKETPAAEALKGSETQNSLTSAGVLIPASPGASLGYVAPGNNTSASGTPAQAAESGATSHAPGDVRETRASGAPLEKFLPLARAREIPADDSRRESPTPHTQSPLPLLAHAVGTERGAGSVPQIDAATAPTQVTPVVAEMIKPGGESTNARAGGGVNVERLTEQVSRHLARRLLVERERRGMSKR
ncbi:MAG: hypothetical protein ACJ754_29305 [Pyrinomonadaceae bacterium]